MGEGIEMERSDAFVNSLYDYCSHEARGDCGGKDGSSPLLSEIVLSRGDPLQEPNTGLSGGETPKHISSDLWLQFRSGVKT